MGMFDSLYVAKSLIDELIKDTDIVLETLNGYYDFQTKDLDNFLTSFYIESDGSFLWEKRTYKEREKKDNEPTWTSPLELDGDPQKIEDTRTAYIDFYDVYTTEEERVFVTFTAHIKCGKLLEPISIKSVERTNLKEEKEKFKPYHEKWDRIRASSEWKIAELIRTARWRIYRIFYPLSKRLDDFENNLRSKAKKRFLDEKDIGYW